MNETVSKLLLTGEESMPKLHSKQSGFTYSVCGPFTKHSERIQKLKETSDLNLYKYI